MRQHFHRCSSLRVLTVEAHELSGDRHGGSVILEELCEANGLARCVGLADCEILAPAQKRELLVARATELRERTGGPSIVADVGGSRGREVAELAEQLLADRAEIVAENLRLEAENALAPSARPDDAPLTTEEELVLGELTIQPLSFRAGRLDAIERGLEAMSTPGFGICARCRGLVEIERLHRAPDSRVCDVCASEALR